MDPLKLLLASTLFPLSVSCTSGEQEPLRTTVCELAGSPARYDGKRVRLQGHFRTDNYHVQAVFDPQCPDKRLDVVGLREATFMPSTAGRGDEPEMVTMLRANPPFLPEGDGFRAQFVGIYRPEKLSSMASDCGTLHVAEVIGLIAEKNQLQYTF